MNKYEGRHVAKTAAKAKKEGLSKGQKVLVGIIIVLVILFFALLIASWALFEKPELPNKDSEIGEDIGTLPVADKDTNPDITDDDPGYGDGIQPKASGKRKSDAFYTVLILGRDTGGGGNTDTMLLASYDVTNQKATVMSIPRDTMVNVSWDLKKINSVYNYYGGGDKGIKALYREISQLVGFEPDYQVVLEWEAVGEIVDAMGGVYFDVPRNMNYDDPTQKLHIHQKKGYRLLSGDDAMQVIRYRYDNDKRFGYPDGDIGRIATQQGLLKAMVKQLLQLKNVTKINEFAKVFEKNVTTDLSFKNICWFGQQAVMGGLSVDDVKFVTMPGNYVASAWSRTTGQYQSYVTPYADELLKLVNEELSPFAETFTLQDLDIMSIKKNGALSSTTGYVEDKQAAYAPSVSSGNTASKPSGGTTTKPSNDDDDDDSHTTTKPSTKPSTKPETTPSNNGEGLGGESSGGSSGTGTGTHGSTGTGTGTGTGTSTGDSGGTGTGSETDPGSSSPGTGDVPGEIGTPVGGETGGTPAPSSEGTGGESTPIPDPSTPEPPAVTPPETPAVPETPAAPASEVDGLGGDATSPMIPVE